MKIENFFEDLESDSYRTEYAFDAFGDFTSQINDIMKRKDYDKLFKEQIYVGHGIYAMFSNNETNNAAGWAERIGKNDATIVMGFRGDRDAFVDLLIGKYQADMLETYLAQKFKSTFIHEFIHAMDFKRTPLKTYTKSGLRSARYKSDPAGYFNDPLETNARLHEVLALIKKADRDFEKDDPRKVKALISHGITKSAKWLVNDIYGENILLLKPKTRNQTYKRVVRMLEPYFTKWQSDMSKLVTQDDIINFALHAEINATDRNYDLEKFLKDYPEMANQLISERDTDYNKFIETEMHNMDLIYHIVKLLTPEQRKMLDSYMNRYLLDVFEKRQVIIGSYLE